MANTDAVIQTDHLTKRYGFLFWKKEKPSLDQLTIEIPRGAIYGFLGPNGAGKTTTIKLLMDLIQPTGGSATVLGRPSWDIKTKRKIGFLPDSPSFNGQMSAVEFLTVCAKLLKIPGSERKARVREVLETVQMSEHAKGKLSSFSRGMLQRIGVAQAILNKPELLILDEPLLGLDPYGRQDFKNIILEQNKQGTTVFFSSHILSDVQEICDHIAILNHGHLLKHGAIKDLLADAGVKVMIHGDDELMKQLMGDADDCRKNNGVWEMAFRKRSAELDAKLKTLQGKAAEGVMEIAEEQESLEDYFFQTIEAADKAQGEPMQGDTDK